MMTKGFPSCPETRLWAAVLKLGIEDYCNTSLLPKHEEREVYRWVHDRERYGVGTFVWVCEMTGYEPSHVRKYVINNSRAIAFNTILPKGKPPKKVEDDDEDF